MRTFAGVMKDAEMFVVRAKVKFDENFEKQAVRLVALKLANTPRSGHHALEGAEVEPSGIQQS
jgi:hypothetical protein